MKRFLLITALVALPLFVTSSVVALEDTPVFGKVTTNKKTSLKATPNAQAIVARTVNANTWPEHLYRVRDNSMRRHAVAYGIAFPMDKTLEAAKAVASARRDLAPLRPLDPDIAPRDEAEGYRIQDAVHAVLAAQVGPLVGYKIGCTSAVMQRYLGIPHPCGGGVFARGVHSSGVNLRHGDYVRVGVECEIAVRLARDLAPTGSAFTADISRGRDRRLSSGDRDRRRPLCRLAQHRRADLGGR